MTTYAKTPPEVRSMLGELVDQHHEHIAKSKLKIELLFAHAATDKNGNPKGPAIVKGGYECAATISLMPVKFRVLGLGDVLILIDGDRWGDWSHEDRRALLDHELCHIQLNELPLLGTYATADDGRPKVELALHDIHIGGFRAVIARHGPNAVEAQLLDAATQTYRQGELDFKPAKTTKRRAS